MRSDQTPCPSRRIFVVGLCFGRAHCDDMIKVAQDFCVRNFQSKHTIEVIVDNKLDDGSIEVSGGKYVIAGDNSCNEFSGWEKGLRYIIQNFSPQPYDVCIMINDTIYRRNYGEGGERYFDDFKIELGPEGWPEQWAAGYLDDFPAPAIINGIEFGTWIRSSFVVFSWSCLSVITPLVFPVTEDILFAQDVSSGLWAEEAPLSENWKAYMSSWLFGEKNPRFSEYEASWYGSEPLNADNQLVFRKKALCIMSEHYLTARLRKAHITFFDFNTYPKRPDRHMVSFRAKDD